MLLDMFGISEPSAAMAPPHHAHLPRQLCHHTRLVAANRHEFRNELAMDKLTAIKVFYLDEAILIVA